MGKSRSSNSYTYFAIFSLVLVMLGLSFAGGSRGVMLPLMKEDLNLSDSTYGWIFLISMAGSITFNFIVGKTFHIMGNKLVMVLGAIVNTSSLVLLAFSANTFQFLLAHFIGAAGGAFLLFGINYTTPLFNVTFQAALLNIVHGSFGLGSTVIQKLSGYLLVSGMTWRQLILYIVFFQLFALLWILFSKYPSIKEYSEGGEVKKEKKAYPLQDKLTYYFIFALGLGLLGEHGINTWLVNYLKFGFGINEDVGANYLSIFFALFTIGRFAGGFLLEKIGYFKGVMIAQIISFVIYMTAITLGENGVFLFPLAGILQSIIYPTIIYTVSLVFKESVTQYLSIIVIGVDIVINVTNFFFGNLNDLVGVRLAFYLIPIQVMISVFFCYKLYKHMQSMQQSRA